MQTESLIQSLTEQTKAIISQAEQLKTRDSRYLTWKQDPETWSILECLEHLNLYGDYYLPRIDGQINATKSAHELVFKPGLLGNYFANSMLPKEKLNKMKTFKDKNPLHANLDKAVIDRFINQQLQLLELLQRARQVSLNKVKVEISISRWIKLKLGDVFRFLINHNIRHLKQVERIEMAMKAA